MRIDCRTTMVLLVGAVAACSSGPQRVPRAKANRPRAAPPRAPLVRRPLLAPRVYEDLARIAALRAALKKGADPHVALALGRLLHLAGRGREARRVWSRARALFKERGATYRPVVVTTDGVSRFAWRGSTLASIRALRPAIRGSRGGWTWLELWDRMGDSYPAPRLRVAPADAGGDIAWAGASTCGGTAGTGCCCWTRDQGAR